jgi:uncharacterized protein
MTDTNSPEPARRFRGFHIMVKPIGPICNLNCRYCFYLEKEKLYPETETKNVRANWGMKPETLERFIRDYIEAQDIPEITFAWQGGEPTLLGVEFFEQAVQFQQQFANGKRINNAFQTNGILIDDQWSEFLAKNNFLIGLSIDGPEELHDRYRRDKGGRPSFAKVFRGMQLFKKHGVEFNTLTCVQRHNALRPLDVYRFLREEGSGFMQFIPIVERKAPPGEDGLTLVKPDTPEAMVTDWSVEPRAYGQFLSDIFDEWVRSDVGRIFVQIFDVSLEAWFGREPSLCVFRETCGDGLALEHNGDLYSCDHYVYPSHRLGNILNDALGDMVDSPFQWKFGTDKRDTLPRYCLECPVHFICHGECPKHRFLSTPEGEPGLNYLCEGYKHFFNHIDPYMKFMAAELRAERPPANVMEYIRMKERLLHPETAPKPTPAPHRLPRPNDSCPCGSGRKFKKCCGKSG